MVFIKPLLNKIIKGTYASIDVEDYAMPSSRKQR
jgi:hypothetical protein